MIHLFKFVIILEVEAAQENYFIPIKIISNKKILKTLEISCIKKKIKFNK